MDITKIDKNFIQTEVTKQGGSVFNIPCEPFTLCGGWYDENKGFIKMPYDISSKISLGVEWGSRCTAGVRLLFCSDAKTIQLKAKLFDKCLMNHMPLVGSAGFTICEEQNSVEIFVGNFIPSLDTKESEVVSQVNLKGDVMRKYILHLFSVVNLKTDNYAFNYSSGCPEWCHWTQQ